MKINKDWAVVFGWLIALMLLFSWSSKADDYSFKYGMGILGNGTQGTLGTTGTIKVFSLRHETSLIHALHYAGEVGLWNDTGSDQGRKSAFFGKAQLGVKPGPQVGFYGKAFWGVSVQSSIDSQLGGYPQFNQDFGIGIRDHTSFVGINYTHISSAGIFTPNKGRDFLGLELGIRFP